MAAPDRAARQPSIPTSAPPPPIPAARSRSSPGPGTGKTRVLTARIAWLIASGRARPEEICAVAFMNDAARQIRERLAAALGEPVARRVWVGTSHRLAARVLRGQAARFGRAARFSIWDEHDVDAALAAIPTETSRALVARTRARAPNGSDRRTAGRSGDGDAGAARRARRLRARQARLVGLRLRRPPALRGDRARVRRRPARRRRPDASPTCSSTSSRTSTRPSTGSWP